MRSRGVLVLVAVVALGAAALLALGDPLGLLGGRARDDAGGGSAADLEAGGPGGNEAADREGKKGPQLEGTLAGRRRGLGALRGRVLDVRTAKGVPQATVTLTGTGNGKEPVALRASTSADGTFLWTDVAAGTRYALRVEAEGVGQRGLPGIEVEANGTTDVGDLWLGKVGAIVGTVVDAADQPVAKATVQLHRGADSLREFFAKGGFLGFFREIHREPEASAEQETRTDGRFRFEAVAPGPHTVLVRAPGFRQALVPVTLLGEGQTEEVRVRLGTGGTLSGVVVDAAGKPVADATIVAMSEEGRMPSPLARTFAKTAADGTFRFDTLGGDGRQMLFASAPGYPNAVRQVNAGETGVRIVLLRGATLEIVLVRDSDGAPIEGADLLVAVGEGTGMATGMPGSLLVGTTDATGRATVDAPVGNLQMLFASHAERPSAFWMGGRGMQMPGMLKGPEDTKVPEGRTQLTFRAPDGIWVVGRVLDPDKRPVVGAEVGTVSFLGEGQQAVSGADGGFRLPTDRASGAALRAKLAGWVQDKVDYGDQKSLMDMNATEVRADILMRPAVSVAGRVLGPDGKPLAGATVVVYRADEGGRGFDMESMFGATQSSLTLADGTYLVSSVPSKTKVRVVARRTGFVDGGTEPFTTAEAGVASAPDVRMLAGVTLRVRVESASGEPLARARVRVDVDRSDGVEGDRFEELMAAQSGADDVRTDAAGVATIELLPPGTVTLRVSASGHAPWGTKHVIAKDAGAGEETTVRLPPGVTLAGVVRDGQGQPVAGASVHVRNGDANQAGSSDADTFQQDWDPNRRVTTDREGKWRAVDLPSRPLVVGVSKDGYRKVSLPVEGSRTELELRLEAQTADQVARIAQIDARLQELYTQMGQKGVDQQNLMREIEALQRERASLGTSDD